MNKYLYILAFLAIGMAACNNEEWDEHYSVQEKTEHNVIDVMEKMPEYSDFVQLIKTAGYDSVLVTNGFFSIFAPTNTALEQVSLEAGDIPGLIEFSIVEKNLFSYNIIDSTIQKTLGGKLSLLRITEDNSVSLDGVPVIQKDIACANGLIHGVSQVRIPRDNIYEYIKGDAEFSILHQLIDSYEEQVFDRANSIEIGVDEAGDIVYDSAWVSVNSLLANTIDINDETKHSTAFLIKDADLKAAVQRDLGAYLGENMDFDILRETYYQMFLNQIIKDDSYTIDEIPLLFVTAAGSIRSIDPSTIVTPDIQLSNGVVHEINDVALSLTDILKEVVIEGEDDSKRTLSVNDGQTSTVYDKKQSGDYWFRFNNFPRDNGWITYVVEDLYQTTYSVYYGSSGKYPNQLRLLVDGEQLGDSFSSVTSSKEYHVGDIEFTDLGNHVITLEYAGDSEDGEINLDYIKLVPHQK